MSLADLPPEIQLKLGEYLAEPELKTLTQLNRWFYQIYSHILYISAKSNTSARNVRLLPRAGILRAAKANNLEAVRRFIELGADVNEIHPCTGYTALHIAVLKDNASIVRVLLDHGADLWVAGDRPLEAINNLGVSYEVGDVLGECKGTANDIFTTIMLISNAPPCMVRKLRKTLMPMLAPMLESKEIHEVAHFLLMSALTDGDIEDVQALLKSMPDVSGPHVQVALSAAVFGGNSSVLKELLVFGENLNVFTPNCPPLMYTALSLGNIEMAKTLHEHGARLNFLPEDPRHNFCPAHGAAASGNVEVLDFALSLGANMLQRSGDCALNTAFHTALKPFMKLPDWATNVDVSLPRSVPMLQRLIDLGCDINAPDGNGHTPLHIAVLTQWPEGVEFLLANGAHPDVQNNVPCPLHYASMYKRIDIMEMLLRYGANALGAAKRNIPFCVSDSVEGTKLLLKHGAPVDQEVDYPIPSALHWTVRKGNVDLMRVLLEAGAPVTTMDGNGLHPLHIAVTPGAEHEFPERKFKRPALVKLLLQHGAPPNGEGSRSRSSPLGLALKLQRYDLVKILMENGADPHQTTKNGWNMLHRACMMNAIEAVRTMLENGADIGRTAPDGRTALHMACSRNRPKIVALLLKYNASINARMRGGRTPLHIASQKGHESVVEILLRHGASPRTQQDNGMTALHLACSRGHEKIMSMLLEHEPAGEFIYVTDCRGRTALEKALSQANPAIIHALLQHDADLKNRITLATRTQRDAGYLAELIEILGV